MNPVKYGWWLALDEPTAARLVGALDMALAPGLVLGPRRAPWLVARIAANAAIAGYALVVQHNNGRYARALAATAFLATASVADSRAWRDIRSRSLAP